MVDHNEDNDYESPDFENFEEEAGEAGEYASEEGEYAEAEASEYEEAGGEWSPENAEAEGEMTDDEPAAGGKGKKAKKGKKKKEKKAGEGPSFLKQITEASPYNVMLWLALMGLLIGIFVMLGELMRYDMMQKP